MTARERKRRFISRSAASGGKRIRNIVGMRATQFRWRRRPASARRSSPPPAATAVAGAADDAVAGMQFVEVVGQLAHPQRTQASLSRRRRVAGPLLMPMASEARTTPSRLWPFSHSMAGRKSGRPLRSTSTLRMFGGLMLVASGKLSSSSAETLSRAASGCPSRQQKCQRRGRRREVRYCGSASKCRVSATKNSNSSACRRRFSACQCSTWKLTRAFG